MIKNPDSKPFDLVRHSYDDFLQEARGMSIENLRDQIEKLKNISDDSNENIATAEMQMQHSTYVEVLEEKQAALEAELI